MSPTPEVEQLSRQIDDLTSRASALEEGPTWPVEPVRVSRILVAVEAAGRDDDALDWAVELAQEHRASIVVVHVVPSQAAIIASAGQPYAGVADAALLEALDLAGREALAAAAAKLRPTRIPFETVLGNGNPGRLLVETAHEHAADLVVLGTRHRRFGTFPRLGPVARAVLHHAKAHVLIARGPPTLHRGVLAATDGSTESKVACATALRIAHGRDATLAIVHVLPPRGRAPPPDLEDTVPLHEEGAIRYDVSIGDPATNIVEAARSSDLVVLGSRGMGGLRSLVLGSVSDEVTRLVGASVLVVKRAAIANVPERTSGTMEKVTR